MIIFGNDFLPAGPLRATGVNTYNTVFRCIMVREEVEGGSFVGQEAVAGIKVIQQPDYRTAALPQVFIVHSVPGGPYPG